MEETAHLPPPPPPPAANLEPPHTLEPISRPSSTSTQNSLAQQLPGISAIAAGAGVINSPQLRATHVPAGTPYSGLPTCQNCQTSTTPLWRRDEQGAILCNACGLFLKLHGRPRPISLKTDVIKSRNRVKTSMRPDAVMRKKQSMGAADNVTAPLAASDLQGQANAATAAMNARRASQNNGNGHIEGADHNSRTGTPNMYAGFHSMDDGNYHTHVAGYNVPGSGDAQSSSPMNGGDAPQTMEQLIAANASLKTRVAELEVINDFIQRRLGTLEGGYGGVDIEALKAQLEDSHNRERNLKRRLDELQGDGSAPTEAAQDESGRAKRVRTEDPDVFIDAPEQPEPSEEPKPEPQAPEQPSEPAADAPAVAAEVPVGA